MKTTPYVRGTHDCAQDDMENAHFSSVGGLNNRDNPTPPYYIKEDEAEEYLRGYTEQAKRMYGDDWKTCTFSWKPVLQINSE